MRVLMVTNKVKTYALGFQNVIGPMLEQGHELVWAADFSGFLGDISVIPCKTEQIDINSNPLKPTNLKAYRQLLQIIDRHNIEALMCSTPIGGMLGRLAAKAKKISPVIYAAHGFLFFKGAPFINRTVYRFQEELMARWTDVLININEEDYHAAENFKLRGLKKHYLIHGAGVKVGQRVQIDCAAKRKELDVPEDAVVIVSAGFLNPNKNNRVVIEALAKLNDPRYCHLLCGDGELKDELAELAKQLGVENQVKLLGYRTDMMEIMAASDIFVMPSFREGVPRALLEAMDLGLPCVGSNTRGIRELIGENGEGGYICDPRSPEDFAEAFEKIVEDAVAKTTMVQRNQEIVYQYSAETVRGELFKIYSDVLVGR